MSLNIKNREADELAAEVSRLTGENKTTAVIVALRERRTRLLAVRIRARMSDTELSSEHLYDPETGLPT